MSADCVNTQNVKDISLRILCYKINIHRRRDYLLRAIQPFQASIALMSDLTPTMFIIRVKL